MMNPEQEFISNGGAEFSLLGDLSAETEQQVYPQPSQFGLSSPGPPGGFQQPQQRGTPFQTLGATGLPTVNGKQGYQQPVQMEMPGAMGNPDGSTVADDIKLFLQENLEMLTSPYEALSPIPQNATNDSESPYINQWNEISYLLQHGSEVVKNEIDRIWIESRDTLFNLSLRKNFAIFLEHMRWDLVDPHDNEQWSANLQLAELLKSELYREVKSRLQNYQGNDELRYQMERWHNSLVDPLISPLHIVQPIQTVLNRERAIIDLTRNQDQQGSASVDIVSHDMQNIKINPENHLAQISAINNDLSEFERVNQEGWMQVQELIAQVQQLQVHLRGRLRVLDMFDRVGLGAQELQALDTLIKKRDVVIEKEKTVLEQYHWPHVKNLQLLVSKVLDDGIQDYQRNTAYIECGKLQSHYLPLDQLQDWCKRLAKLVSSNLQQMDKLIFLEQQLGLDARPQPANGGTLQFIQQLVGNYSFMIEELVRKGLVVEKHPPQVLMKDKRFQSQLRHLVGDALDIHKLSFRVNVSLINGENAQKVLKEGATSTFEKSGDIINDKASSDFISQTGILSVTMRTMCLKMQQRGAQRSSEMVAELKFAMLFRTEITVRYLSHQTTVAAQALSLPIVVISHGKQEADAQATIFWDNAFARVNRPPFKVEDSVPWTAMLDALDARWKIACKDGNAPVVGLTDLARQYLTTKLYGKPDVPSGTIMSWRMFNQDKVVMCGGSDQRRDHLFTFWTWFYKAMELCSCKYVKKYWNLGYIHGFLSKTDCHNMLIRAARGEQAGIFMFRFSETQLGAVSISCTVKEDGTDRIQVHNIAPDTVAEFKVRSLPDMVQDLKYLRYLYPNIPKDQAFGSYYSNANRGPHFSGGYVQKQFRVSTDTDPMNHSLDPNAESPAPPGYPLPSPATRLASRDSNSMDEEDSN